jgi:hypothetical protein
MKTYDYNDAMETLQGLLCAQDKTSLAKELAKIVIKESDKSGGYSLKSLEMSVYKEGNKFNIKIGEN